mgnify:CR=1 FL=1
MPKYQIEMNFTYEVETDDIERTLKEFEFPLFNYPDQDSAEFIDNTNKWMEVTHA